MNKEQTTNLSNSINETKYEPSRHLMDFHLAGFAYYDGLDVIHELTLGQTVTLACEPDNPVDAEAVAIYYKNKKLGYVPANYNHLFSTMLFFGHHNIFEYRIQASNMEAHPERQFRVIVKIKDNRNTNTSKKECGHENPC